MTAASKAFLGENLDQRDAARSALRRADRSAASLIEGLPEGLRRATPIPPVLP